MSRHERILCPVDFSEFSKCALAFAGSIARRFGSSLFVQHVVEAHHNIEAGFDMAKAHADGGEYLRAKGQQSLAKFLQGGSVGDLQPAHVVSEGTATEAILEFAVSERVDLIVMGTHSRRGLDRFMLGSVTERVVQKATCPVLVVHGRAAEVAQAGRLPTARGGKILLCTDLSDRSRRAVDYGWPLAADYGADITLLHVLDTALQASPMRDSVLRAMDRLESLAPPKGYELAPSKVAIRIGKPYEEIIALAMEGRFDLVMLSACGEGVRDTAVFGSTTNRVIQLGPCPVLVVPS